MLWKVLERVIEGSPLTTELENTVTSVKEPGTRELIQKAIELHRSYTPDNIRFATEKIWDAYERLKTYYTSLDKRASADKIIFDMSASQPAFIDLFTKEFKALTEIGIQVADLISGTLSYVFDNHKKANDTPDYLKILKEKTIRIELYPKTYENYVLENSAIAEDYDEEIAKLCFAQAVKFVEHNNDNNDPEVKAQVIVLQYLLFRFMNNDTRGYIYTYELKDQLANTELRNMKDQLDLLDHPEYQQLQAFFDSLPEGHSSLLWFQNF